MSGWVAGATVVGAGLSYAGSKSASKAASKDSAAQLAFEQEKHDDWQETYGPIEDNLASYYDNLSPEYYEVQGLEAFEKERTIAFEDLERNLAQRGITSSGIAAKELTSESLDTAQTRASIRTQAPAMAAQDKLNFLQVGLGQNPDASMSQALADRTRSSEAAAREADRAAGEAIGTAVTTVGTALSDYNTQGQQ